MSDTAIVEVVEDVITVTTSDDVVSVSAPQDVVSVSVADAPFIPHDHPSYAELDGAVFTGDVTAPNMTGVVSLANGADVPAGTPPGTLVARYTS